MRISNIIVLCILMFPFGASSQNDSNRQMENSSASTDKLTFEEFCLQESIYYITISKQKVDAVSFAGELISLKKNPNATHVDYQVEPKPEEAQYFKLIGSDQVLVVKSMYVLQLTYNNYKNK